jgi:pyruvate/2-oxoglutarate dehydrogenase complex dihydrolipoamide dehydrogenase (E3) component
VVGGGKAGKSLAMDLAAAGQRVAMVERGMIGGTCINVACLPTKTLVNSARLLALARRAAPFGIDLPGTPAVDIDLLRARKEDVVGTMVAGQRKSFLASGMDLAIGEAHFVVPRTVEVTDDAGTRRTLSGTNVVVNTGMAPFVPDIPGLRAAQPLTSTSILALKSLPRSIIILGRGYIGCEFASMLSIMGVQVTAVQRRGQLLPREDADMSASVAGTLAADGATLVLGAEAAAVSRAGGLVVRVDEFLRTAADNVWAAGDVAGTPQFTHASWNDYRILKANIAGGSWSTKDRLIPYCVFTTPELGRVGLSETEALHGHESSEVIAVIQMAMLGDVPYQQLRDAVITHPTMAEGLQLLLSDAFLEP